MGFFQNLKEDYEAAVDELLGGESEFPEDETQKKPGRGRKKPVETVEDTEQVELDLDDMMALKEDAVQEEMIHEDLVEDGDMELESEIVSQMSDILDGAGQDEMPEGEREFTDLSELFSDDALSDDDRPEDDDIEMELSAAEEDRPEDGFANEDPEDGGPDDNELDEIEFNDDEPADEEQNDAGLEDMEFNDDGPADEEQNDDELDEIEFNDDDLTDDDFNDDDLDDMEFNDDDLADEEQDEEDLEEIERNDGDLADGGLDDGAPEEETAAEELPEEPVKAQRAEAPSIFRKFDERQDNIADSGKEEEKSNMAAENLMEEETVSKTVIPELSEEEEMEVSDETATITKGMKVAGNIKSNGNLDLEGVVVGNIRIAGKANIFGEINGDTQAGNVYADGAQITGAVKTTGSVKVAQSSVIIGDISATSAVIAGAVKGNIDVHGPVILDSTAIVMGDIKSQSVQITSGAVVEGMCSQCYAKVSPASFFDQLGK